VPEEESKFVSPKPKFLQNMAIDLSMIIRQREIDQRGK
jgi:hypothetical protein